MFGKGGRKQACVPSKIRANSVRSLAGRYCGCQRLALAFSLLALPARRRSRPARIPFLGRSPQGHSRHRPRQFQHDRLHHCDREHCIPASERGVYRRPGNPSPLSAGRRHMGARRRRRNRCEEHLQLLGATSPTPGFRDYHCAFMHADSPRELRRRPARNRYFKAQRQWLEYPLGHDCRLSGIASQYGRWRGRDCRKWRFLQQP